MINLRNRVIFSPFGVILLTALSLAFPAFAQQQQPPAPDPAVSPQSPSSRQQSPSGESARDDKSRRQPEHNGTSNDRLFYTLPNFLTIENTDKIPPLTTRQKFSVVARSSFDIAQYPWYGFLAGISQAQNNQAGYGQGAAGYGKRYGAAWADGTLESYWTVAILPSALHQDPRYYQMGKRGFWHRLGYAMSRITVTRSDSGNSQFNSSEIFGSMISAGISTYSYYPRGDRTVRNAGILWGSLLGYDTMTFIGREFWPDIRRKLRKK